MNMLNPYNCTRPGHLFVGYERLRRRIINGFAQGNSYALLGGRRCGKTSLLLQIERDLSATTLSSFKPVPHYLDIQSMGKLTPALLFEEIYHIIVQDITAPPWSSDNPDRAYQHFLKQLDAAKIELDKQYGTDWLVILLIDELDAALASLSDDQFFQNLRNLLMVSRFNRHFRVVASGVKEMTRLISSGSSPLNNLRTQYLKVLTGKQARELIRKGFDNDFDPELERYLFEVTGRHPYLMQGLLEILWNDKNELGRRKIKTAAREFLREHHDFHRWLEAFGPAEHAIYQTLMNAPNRILTIDKIRTLIDPAFVPEIDDALTVLSFHGIIEDSDPDEPQISSAMFCDWYQKNKPVPQLRSSGSTPLPTPQRDAPHSSNQPIINIQMNPTIGHTVNSGLTVAEVLETLTMLKSEITSLPLNKRAKMEVEHALDEGIVEVEEPEAGKTPDKEVVKSALEKTANTLKSAGTTADEARSFLEKAEKLAPYVGQAAGWLSGLFMFGFFFFQF